MSKLFTPEQIDAAMLRAAKSARDLAKQTGTKLALGQIYYIAPVDPNQLIPNCSERVRAHTYYIAPTDPNLLPDHYYTPSPCKSNLAPTSVGISDVQILKKPKRRNKFRATKTP